MSDDSNVSNNQKEGDNQNPQNTPPSPQGIRRLVTLLLEISLLAVLAFIVVLNWSAIKNTLLQSDNKGQRERRVIAEPSGDKAAEKEAADKLTAFKDKKGLGKYLVISERVEAGKPDKRVTSINYKGAKIDEE